MSSLSSSEVGKRKIDITDNTNSPPFKKQKTCSIIHKNYGFPTLICVDYINEFYVNNIFSLFISNDRNLFSVGYSGHTSHGHENNEIFPIKQIQDLTNIKMIDCGHFHSVALDYNGDVYSFGSNNYQQLGIGKNDKELKQTHIPQKIILPSCKQVSCGNRFTICLTEDNKLFSFGENNKGQLGLGNNDDYNSPQLIPDLNNIEYIVCGGYYSICKTYDNELYSWGDNNDGQLGQSNDESCNKPIQCLNWPDNIIDIKCGNVHTLLLTSEGQVYSFGCNFYGQLGINDKKITSINTPTLINDISEIQRIECGSHHSMCIDINDNLWLFGSNFNGGLGLGDKNNKFRPLIHPTLSNIIDISSGGKHTFVKTIENKIYAFGDNRYSQLGIVTSEYYQLTPIQVFKDKEDIWSSIIVKSKQKSARK